MAAAYASVGVMAAARASVGVMAAACASVGVMAAAGSGSRSVPGRARCSACRWRKRAAQDADAGPAPAALLEAALHRPPAAADQHGELRRAAGRRRRAAAGLAAPPPPPRRPAAGGPHRPHVRRRLQHGPAAALLVPLAGRRLPGAGRAGAENRPEESPHRPAGGIARHGRLVFLRHRHAGRPVPGGELGGAEGEILGVLQGRLERLAGGSAAEFPLRPAPVPGGVRQRGHAGLGHLPLLPQIQARQPPERRAGRPAPEPARRRDVKRRRLSEAAMILEASGFSGRSARQPPARLWATAPMNDGFWESCFPAFYFFFLASS